jgi:hypothetical protein
VKISSIGRCDELLTRDSGNSDNGDDDLIGLPDRPGVCADLVGGAGDAFSLEDY